ncbi:MAG: hypothetical protein DRP09_16990 [Candidatus Thorarchaeota archaeon]|nr:MAG: hypothetical protein DRP09_16990 [Candidatus Thorarchaeota archaeon]
MSWTAYKLVYRAMSPIHIGYHKLGFIQRTRHYILGRNLWGALIANLTRVVGSRDYEKIKEWVTEDIRFSYLYPTLSKDGNDALLPIFTKDGLKYGDYPAHEFERIFIHAYTQTALEPSSLTAEEGSLHETEYIAPMVKTKDGPRQVFFVGYIFLKAKSEIELKDLQQALDRIFVGGERKYGFGQLKLEGEISDFNEGRLFGIFPYKSNGDDILLTIPKGKPIPSHLEITDNMEARLKGDIEPLVGLEYGVRDKKVGFGQSPSKCRLCWVPGSVVTDGEPEFAVGEHGILKAQQ